MGREEKGEGRENLGGPGPPNVFFLELRLHGRSASDVSAVVPYICRQISAQSVATVVLFSVVSVCGSLGVCV